MLQEICPCDQHTRYRSWEFVMAQFLTNGHLVREKWRHRICSECQTPRKQAQYNMIPKSYLQLTRRSFFLRRGDLIFSSGHLDPVHTDDVCVNHESKDEDYVTLEGWDRPIEEVLEMTLALLKYAWKGRKVRLWLGWTTSEDLSRTVGTFFGLVKVNFRNGTSPSPLYPIKVFLKIFSILSIKLFSRVDYYTRWLSGWHDVGEKRSHLNGTWRVQCLHPWNHEEQQYRSRASNR